MTRLAMLDFEKGSITAWVKVSGGPVHRVQVVGPLAVDKMRQVVYDPGVIEQFRVQAQAERLSQDGGEAA